MLARDHVEADMTLVVNHHAISPDIDPIAVEILGHHHATRADVGAAIFLVPEGRGKDADIHVMTLADVIEHGARVDEYGIEIAGAGLPELRLAAQGLHEVAMAPDLVEPQQRRQTQRAAGRAGDDAVTLREARDVVEKKRVRLVFLDVQFADSPELEIAVRAGNVGQLATRAHVVDPYPKVERMRVCLGHDLLFLLKSVAAGVQAPGDADTPGCQVDTAFAC